MKSKAFLFFGRSGCGKGTQVKLLENYLKEKGEKIIYIETGSEFRNFIQQENYSAQLAKDILGNGGLIPVFLPIGLWTNILIDKFSGVEVLILDGLCRRYEEAIALDSAFDFYKIEKVNIILIDVSEKWSFERMMARKRTDDTPEKINNRLSWFEKDVVPSINYFKKNSKYNFISINGEQSIEAVHQEIINKLNF